MTLTCPIRRQQTARSSLRSASIHAWSDPDYRVAIWVRAVEAISVKPSGSLFMNVCLEDKADLTADTLAERLTANGWPTKILDQRGTARNAIVLGGNVKGLRRPRLRHVPQTEVARIRRELGGMRFRRRRARKD